MSNEAYEKRFDRIERVLESVANATEATAVSYRQLLVAQVVMHDELTTLTKLINRQGEHLDQLAVSQTETTEKLTALAVAQTETTDKLNAVIDMMMGPDKDKPGPGPA